MSRPREASPTLFGSERLIMLALTGRLRRTRVVPGGTDHRRWARAWARRWWIVQAESADLVRDAVARYEERCARVGLSIPVDAREYGILESGRNAPGAPEHPPWVRSRRTPPTHVEGPPGRRQLLPGG